jgi:hypothetical protein
MDFIVCRPGLASNFRIATLDRNYAFSNIIFMIFLLLAFGFPVLVAFIFGAIGILCTVEGQNKFPGFLFGLPAVMVSLIVSIECTEMALPWFAVFAIATLIMGGIVIWRGLRNGQKNNDFIMGALVSLGIFAAGFFLSQEPDLVRVIFSHFLLGGSPL